MKRARRVFGERARAGARKFKRSKRLAACAFASLTCSVSANVARAESSRHMEEPTSQNDAAQASHEAAEPSGAKAPLELREPPRDEPTPREARETSNAEQSTPELAELPGAVQSAPSLQWNVGLLLGPCVVGNEDDVWERTRACAAVRSDVFFLRRREASWGLGPYASAGTAGFDDARLGAGLSLLAPVVEDFPLVASLGGLVVLGDDQSAAPGVEAWLFWGARSFNFHGSYALANGVLLGAQTTFEEQRRHAVWLAVELDAAIPLLPFVLVAGWLRGAPD